MKPPRSSRFFSDRCSGVARDCLAGPRTLHVSQGAEHATRNTDKPFLPTRARSLAPAEPREHGIALVIVMISIFVLTILAGGFAYSMKVETRLARNANSETELEWLGRSGKWVVRSGVLAPGH